MRAPASGAEAVDRDAHEVDRPTTATSSGVSAPVADAGQLEHLVDQAFQPGRFGVRVLEQLASVGRVERRSGGEERRGRGLDGGERRPEVVGDRGEEPGARPVELALHALLARGGVDALELERGSRPSPRGP